MVLKIEKKKFWKRSHNTNCMHPEMFNLKSVKPDGLVSLGVVCL